MRMFLILPLVILGACAPLATALNPPYMPAPIHIYDQTQYDSDNKECAQAGADWKPHFSFGAVAAKTISGATSNSSLIPISPLVPAYGAAGAALSATTSGLDVMSVEHANVYRNCLRDATRRDRSAIVADPRD